jgi:hypothetical protein
LLAGRVRVADLYRAAKLLEPDAPSWPMAECCRRNRAAPQPCHPRAASPPPSIQDVAAYEI